MKKIMGKNKKGIIGDTFVWVFATFLIVLLLMLYMGIVYYMSEKKVIMGRYDVETTGRYYGDDFTVLQSFYSFLRTSVVYQGEEYMMKDLLLRSPPDKEDKELYNLVNNTMKKYCSEYNIWVPDVSFHENGADLNPYVSGRSYFFIDPDKVTPWNYPAVYMPDESKEREFISFSVLKECLGDKLS